MQVLVVLSLLAFFDVSVKRSCVCDSATLKEDIKCLTFTFFLTLHPETLMVSTVHRSYIALLRMFFFL